MCPYLAAPSPPSLLDGVGPVSPIYIILILGMIFFMFSNVTPGLLPDPEKIGHLAPMILQWGFAVCIFALVAQMTGLIPGVPRVHITYVHMAIAFLLELQNDEHSFILMWNHIVMTLPEEPKPSSSSSSSSRKEEKKEEKKESKDEKEDRPSPWDDLRAHPSAFLTTKLNRLLPWPFPMGKASGQGTEVWWESGTPAHVGHFNRPDPEIQKAAVEAEKKRMKEKEIKVKEAEKKKEKEKAKAEAEKEAAEKARKKEIEARRMKEMERAKATAIEAAKRKAIEDRQKQKLWRTKYLAMIIGISLVNRTFGFLLLLLFSLQLISQEMNAQPDPAATASSASASVGTSSAATATARASDSDRDKDKAPAAKLDAVKKEKEKAEMATGEGSAAKSKSSSSSSSSKSLSSAKPSSSSSSPAKPSGPESSSSSTKRGSGSSKSSSSSSKSSSSSSSSKKPIIETEVKEAAGTRTVTADDPAESHIPVPYQLGFGMHYIHTKDKAGELDLPASFIPSEGLAHPLMTTTYSGWAN